MVGVSSYINDSVLGWQRSGLPLRAVMQRKESFASGCYTAVQLRGINHVRSKAVLQPRRLISGSTRQLLPARLCYCDTILPDVEVVEFDDLGHMGAITHPQQVNDVIARFLDSKLRL